MPRQMSGVDAALFRAVVIKTETTPSGRVRAFSPVVFGPHETLSPVKAAVTRYKRDAERWSPRGSGEISFTVDFQKTPIVWESVKVDA
jgi:hypothetical protein